MTVWVVDRRTRHGEDVNVFSSRDGAWAAAAEMAIMDAEGKRVDADIAADMDDSRDRGDFEDVVYMWRERVARDDHDERIEVRSAEIDQWRPEAG